MPTTSSRDAISSYRWLFAVVMSFASQSGAQEVARQSGQLSGIESMLDILTADNPMSTGCGGHNFNLCEVGIVIHKAAKLKYIKYSWKTPPKLGDERFPAKEMVINRAVEDTGQEQYLAATILLSPASSCINPESLISRAKLRNFDFVASRPQGGHDIFLDAAGRDAPFENLRAANSSFSSLPILSHPSGSRCVELRVHVRGACVWAISSLNNMKVKSSCQ